MKNKAFTLIEVLIVVLIIAILAAIAVPQYKKAVIKSKLAQVDVGITTAIKNIDLYFNTNSYPAYNGGIRRFTGTQSIADVKMPGDCDSHGYLCKTNVGGFSADCRKSEDKAKCLICYSSQDSINGKYSYDVTVYVRRDEGEDVWYISQISSRDSSYIIKIFCQWAKERGYLANSATATKCANLGVTLKSKDN